MGRAAFGVDAWVEIGAAGEVRCTGHLSDSAGLWTNHAHAQAYKRCTELRSTSVDRVAVRRGHTIVPLYFIGGASCAEAAPLAKGKQERDKRQALREKQDQRESSVRCRYVKQARR